MSVNPSNVNDGRRTILIVDDFDDTRLLLRTWLQKKGFHVVEAENGIRAMPPRKQPARLDHHGR